MSEQGWGAGTLADGRRTELCPICECQVTSVLLLDGHGHQRRYIEPHADCRGSYRLVEGEGE